MKGFFDWGVEFTTRTIYLGSAVYNENGLGNGVDFYMAERFIKALHLLEKSNHKPIEVIMNNPGGSCVDGMAIYDAIKSAKSEVTIKVFGDACSMGCVILQAADYRILAPHSVVMFHEGYDGHSYNHPEIVKRWVHFNTKYGEIIDKLVYNRMVEKDPNLKYKKFKEMNLFDTILTAPQAVGLGLADTLLE